MCKHYHILPAMVESLLETFTKKQNNKNIVVLINTASHLPSDLQGSSVRTASDSRRKGPDSKPILDDRLWGRIQQPYPRRAVPAATTDGTEW